MKNFEGKRATAWKTNGIRESIPYCIEQTNNKQVFSISHKLHFADTKKIELNGLEHIAANSEEGYFVVPRCNESSDYALCLFRKHTEDFEQTFTMLNMPVFGIKTKDRCLLLIADGMKYNFGIRLVLENGTYHVYPFFEVDGEEPYEDFSMEMVELKGEDADYSGMARYYRKYRMDKGEILPLEKRMKENSYLDYAVNSVMIRIRCGWKPAPAEILHQTLENEPEMHVACDFDRVGDILDELKAQGVEKAEICLVGWNIKGHDGRWPQAFPVCEELGGEKKLRSLIQKAQEMGYQITCHTNSTDQYEIADCFDLENTRRNKEGQPIVNPPWSGGQMHDLCPKIGYEQAVEMLPQVADLGFKGIHYIDVLGVVYPRKCYHEAHPVSYQQSVEYARKICSIARKEFGGISSEGAYDYLAPALDYGLYISFSDSELGVCDKPIPFWQLVYHGIVLSNPYAATVNSTFKEKDIFLKLLEYGGRPSYYYYSAFMGNGNNWMGNVDARCRTDEELKESVSKIKSGYDEYQKLQPLYTAFMEKHEEVVKNVFKITYSNGMVLKIDYNEKLYSLNM